MDDRVNKLRESIAIVRSERTEQNRSHEHRVREMKSKLVSLKEKLCTTSYKPLSEERIHDVIFGEYLKRNPGVVSHAVHRFAADQKQLEMLKDHCTDQVILARTQMWVAKKEGATVKRQLQQELKASKAAFKASKRENEKIVSGQEKTIQHLEGQTMSREAEDSFNKSLMDMWEGWFSRGDEKAHNGDALKLYESVSSLKFELDIKKSFRTEPTLVHAAALTA